MKTIKIAVLTVVALATALGVSRAQPLVPNPATSVRFPFTDTTPGFSTPSDATFGVSLNLTNYNRNHALTNYHGIYGSGTSGLHVALDLTTNSEFATPGGEGSSLVSGPCLVVTNAALAFGAIQSFTASIWSNPKNAANSGTTEIRYFILGHTGDKANAANIGMFWQTVNQLAASVGATTIFGAAPSWPTTDSPGTFPTNQWLFQCLTYDGSTVTLYTGTDGGGPLAVSSTLALAGTTVTMTSAGNVDELQIGNRQDTGARPFCGRLDDFRFYGSTATVTGAATAAQVEDIFWAGQAPTNIAAIAGNNVANLTWSPLANAASYTISRSSTSGGPYTQLATGLTSPSYSDTTALNNQTYYYVVSALDGTGDQTAGPNSYEYQFTVVAPPSQPVVTPTAGSDQVVLNWTASAGSPGPITYNVARSTTPGAEVTIASGLSATTYTDTTAVSEIQYYYVVIAVNDGLPTATTASAEVTATPVGPPPAPIIVNVGPDGAGQAYVSWTDVSATSYNILRATSQGGPYTSIATGVTGTSYVDTTIVPSVDYYYYEVVAVNALSLSSPPSGPSYAVPGGQGNQLANADFEITSGLPWVRTTGPGASTGSINIISLLTAASVPTTYYNAGMCPADVPAEPIVTHSGTNVANVYDYQAAGSFNKWSQAVGCTPGSIMAASAWTLAPHEDLSGPCIFYYEVDFLDLAGNMLAAYESFGISNLTCAGPNSFPLDTWVSLAVTNEMLVTGTPATNSGIIVGTTGPSGAMTAPPGTASANFIAKFVDIGAHGGSIYFDDCDLDLIAGPVPPTITAITNTVNGACLVTNTYVTVTATSSTGTITNAYALVQTHGLTGGTNTVTNNLNATSMGIGTATVIITNPLSPNLYYSLKILATDNDGNTASTPTAVFDTMAPVLVIEAEDYNFSSGQFIDTPANGGLALYALQSSNGFVATQGVDLHGTWGGSQAANGSYYRNTDLPICGYANPQYGTPPNNLIAQKYLIAAANGDATDVSIEVGYNNGGDWLNYTRTYGPGTPGVGVSAPAGAYTIWGRMCTVGGGAAEEISLVTSDPTQPNQTTTLLGTFSFTDNGWNTYVYVPMLDSYGNLVSVNLSGVETLQAQVVGNPNLDFYMLVPVVPVYTPGLQYSYPDGVHPFEPTNSFTFTVGPNNGAPIASSGIDLVLNGVDVTSGVTLTHSGSSWIGSYPIKSNAVYSAVLSVTNTASPTPLYSVFNISFDTFNPTNYQWEAVDYDFSENNGTVWVSGMFIDNPVPTCDTASTTVNNFAANSYYGFPTGFTPGVDPTGHGAVAQQNIDIYFPNDGQTAGANEIYRADGVGSQAASDYVRPQFLAERLAVPDPSIGPVNIGYYGNGYWLNYTRTWPANTYTVWGRLAGGAGPFSGTRLSLVTSGVGTATQTTTDLGTFSDPNAVGWQAWHWIPLLDGNGNMVDVSLGGVETLRVTSGNNLNTEFFMLVPTPLPVQLAATVAAGQIQISVPTQSGYKFTVMYTSSLTPPIHWTQVGSAIPGDGTVHVVPITLTGTQGYYQVLAQ